MTDGSPRATKTVAYEDVDDIIEIAARKKQAASAEILTVEDLESVARELDIPAEFVQPAMAELERRRSARAASLRRRRQLMIQVSLGAVAVVALLFMAAYFDQSSLRGDLSAAQQKQAQVLNVMERQARTEAYFADQPDSADRSAELAGALNRVSIERRRYDEAASTYNARAQAFPTSLSVRLFGLPARLPMSHEREQW